MNKKSDNSKKKVEEMLKSDSDLMECTKEELIKQIKSLRAHNTQLKNIIAKKTPSIPVKRQSRQFDFSKCDFRHIALKFFYLGWDYKGYVIQEDTINTIENHLFEALMKTKLIKDRASSNYHRCGRTDKGVSSFGQVISIDVRSNLKLSNSDVEEINYCKILNKVLPDNIQCLAWSPVEPNFSARFDCLSRTYKYYFPKENLNIKNMEMAAQKLLGVHDFRNFCKMDVGNGVTEFIRNIFEINVEPTADNCNEYSIYVIKIKAKAFLWHQIRCIMGILLLIGQEKEAPNIIDELLDVEKHPKKPDYGMASEIPLNLFCCEYENLAWKYDEESLESVIQKLNTIWTINAVKQAMVKDMLTNVKSVHSLPPNDSNCLSNVLLTNTKAKTYIPVMKRPTCNSLEDKIKHFAKRKKFKQIESK